MRRRLWVAAGWLLVVFWLYAAGNITWQTGIALGRAITARLYQGGAM